MPDHSSQLPPGPREFATTRWSLVLSAGDDLAPDSREALEHLCSIYWRPLYAMVRRQGFEAQRAADITQGFFAQLLERADLAEVNPKRGKFRSFLLASMKHFVHNEIDAMKALKRGGGRTILSFDFQQADSQLKADPADHATPDAIFDRQWALTLLEQVRSRLREEFESRQNTAQFERLGGFLSGRVAEDNYARASEELGISEGAVKVIVHRMRQRFGELLREEIAHTVGSEELIDEEIQALFAVLGGR